MVGFGECPDGINLYHHRDRTFDGDAGFGTHVIEIWGGILIRFFVFGLCTVGAAFGLWFYGFVRFIEMIPRHAPGEDVYAEAIVVLTGGNGRLQAGFDLLARNGADALLISGVGPGVDLESLLSHRAWIPAFWRDQISMGYQAGTRRGMLRKRQIGWKARVT